MKVTKEQIMRFKELNAKVKAGKATSDEESEAKKLASLMFKKGSKPKRNSSSSSGSNDVSWYQKYPELFRDSANIIFNEIAGTQFNHHFPLAIRSSMTWPTTGLRFDILPTIGKSTDANDAFNYQMRSLWLQLHRVYRGVGTYEYADLGIAIFSIMCAFAEVARAERIYGILNKFDPLNRSFPLGLLNALRVDVSTIPSANVADFRYQLNRIIAKARLLCLPKGMSAFEQYITLYGNVFKDSDNPRAQWYFYDCPVYPTYDPTLLSTGSAIVYAPRRDNGSGFQSLQDILDDLNTMFDNLLLDTDIARMCSDILKAFGENGIQTLLPVPEDFTIELINDDVRKLQMHNTVFTNYVAGSFSSSIFGEIGATMDWNDYLTIYQEGGVIKQSLFSIPSAGPEGGANWKYGLVGGAMIPCVTTSAMDPAIIPVDDPFLNSWHDNVSPEEVVEMTRQTITRTHIHNTTIAGYLESYALDSYSSYVVMNMTVFDNDITGLPYIVGTLFNNIEKTPSGFNTLEIIAHLSNVDWHPYFGFLSYVSGNPSEYDVIYDLDNYSLISKESLRRLHETCTLSLFKLDIQSSGE